MERIRSSMKQRSFYFLLGILGLLYITIPIFKLKLLLLGTIIILVLKRIPKNFTIVKSLQIFFPTFIFGIALLIVPYWAKKQSPLEQVLEFTIGILAFLIILYVYRKHSEQTQIIKSEEKFNLIFTILFIFYSLYQFLPLHKSIPFMGDSDYFITNSFNLILYLFQPRNIPLLAISILSIIFYFKTKKTRHLFLLLGSFIAIGILSVVKDPHSYNFIMRYPILFHYTNSLLSIPILSIFQTNLALSEGFFRIQSFLCVLVIACIVIKYINLSTLHDKCLFGLAILTIPTLSYYSTLTYIEPIMLVFVLYALLSFESGLKKFIESEKISPWVIALFIVFSLKETTVVYAFSFIIVTSFMILKNPTRSLLQRVNLTLSFCCLTAIPLVVYLIFRHGSGVRPYEFTFNNFLSLKIYEVLVASFWEQFSIFFPIACISIFLLLFRKKFLILSINSIIIFGYLILYIGDKNAYFGYSRFNLYFLPSILFLVIAAWNEFEHLISKKIKVLIILPIIIANILLSPIYLLDGTRKPKWGDHIAITSELDFPYQDLYKWLSKNKFENIWIVGRTRPYWDDFYIRKYDLNPDKFKSILIHEWKDYKSKYLQNIDIIVFHNEVFRYGQEALGKSDILQSFLIEQEQIISFENKYLRLDVYTTKK